MRDDEVGAPLYDRVAATLREQILNGRWATGDRLSTEAELIRHFGVSRVTIRRAISALLDDGLVVVRQGVGTFVQMPRAAQDLNRLETLEATLSGQGFAPVTEVVEFSFDSPSNSVRAALQLAEDEEILFVRRVHSVADGPIGIVDLAVPAGIGRLWSRHDVEHRPFYELLPSHGIQLGPAHQVIRASAMTKELAALSGIGEGTPVLVCERLTLDAADRPIIHALFTYRSDRFEFSVSLHGGPDSTSWVPSGLAITGGTAL